jgi:hypothetical protein
MEIGVRLTVVGSQGEADVICSLLRAHRIECSERPTDLSAERWGGHREILVRQADLAAAQELLRTSSD